MGKSDNTISMATYRRYVSSGMDLRDVLKKLKGKRIEDRIEPIEDCGVYFVSGLLNRDWGRSIVYNYTIKELEFIGSKCLSDYFKDSIRELLDGTMSKELENILNGLTSINNMSEKEIKMIYDALVKYYQINGKSSKPNISSKFLTYLYKLDGRGVASFIKNNIDGVSIARQVLLTSGLNDRASYYSGRGVVYSDLNENNLVAIFNKLLRIDDEFAFSFIDMVCEMKTLGATEFINSFLRLGSNGFRYDKTNIAKSNVSLNGVSGQARDAVAFMSVFSVMNGKDEAYQIRESVAMKKSFLLKIKDMLEDMRREDFIQQMYEDEYYFGRR